MDHSSAWDLLIAFDIAMAATNSELGAYVDSARELWVVVMLCWFALRLIGGMEKHFIEQSGKKGTRQEPPQRMRLQSCCAHQR